MFCFNMNLIEADASPIITHHDQFVSTKKSTSGRLRYIGESANFIYCFFYLAQVLKVTD